MWDKLLLCFGEVEKRRKGLEFHVEGVSLHSCKEWGQISHYIFKTLNKGSLVTDKTVAKAPSWVTCVAHSPPAHAVPFHVL